MKILVTGGTGSFGQEFCKQALNRSHDVTVFSRCEFKQNQMKIDHPNVTFRIGDVRDKERLEEVLSEFEYDIVIHAAALKRVEVGENIPSEVIKTNINGSMNISSLCKKYKIKLLAISTDKAVRPMNLYGATKLTMEKLILQDGGYIVRYGNVLSSRGSVIPTFLKLKREGTRPQLRTLEATRFLIRLEDAVKFVIDLIGTDLDKMDKINIPPMKAARIQDIANIMFDEGNYDVIPLEPGEKLAEDITETLNSENAEKYTNDELKELIKEVEKNHGG